MKSIITGIFMVLVCSGTLVAQELSYFSGFWSTEYYQDNQKIEKKEFESLLEADTTAYELWENHEKQMIYGGVFAIAELGLLIWTISDLSNDKNALGPALGTLGAAIISGIFINKGLKKKRDAVLHYNEGLNQKTSFRIEPAKSGLGMLRPIIFLLLSWVLLGCNTRPKTTTAPSEVQIAGAMKEVMWNGKLGSSIDLDTITPKKGLYGLGPETYLRGELLINDGTSYVSRIRPDSTILVEKTYAVSAPFFVYDHIPAWKEAPLPSHITSISDLESYLSKLVTDHQSVFAFKLNGRAKRALIHCQNLSPGAVVSSPDEAHEGQIDYLLEMVDATIVGFYSTRHQGIFTHHDSFLHMHLITSDEQYMGHLDALEIDQMTLFLPDK